MLLNLISNGVKFTVRGGSVNVKCKLIIQECDFSFEEKRFIELFKEAKFGILFKSTKEIISKNNNFFNCDSYRVLLNTINKKHKEWSKNNVK